VDGKWFLDLPAKKLLTAKSEWKMENLVRGNYTYILISSIEYYFPYTRVRARYGPPGKIVANAACKYRRLVYLSFVGLI